MAKDLERLPSTSYQWFELLSTSRSDQSSTEVETTTVVVVVLQASRAPMKELRRFLEGQEHAPSPSLDDLRDVMVLFHQFVDDNRERIVDELHYGYAPETWYDFVEDLEDLADVIWYGVNCVDEYRALLRTARDPPVSESNAARRKPTKRLARERENTRELIDARSNVLSALRSIENTLNDVVRAVT
jgi:hypothetical protein